MEKQSICNYDQITHQWGCNANNENWTHTLVGYESTTYQFNKSTLLKDTFVGYESTTSFNYILLWSKGNKVI